MGYIYLMYNKITSKIYIGQTTCSIQNRMLAHFSKAEHNKELKDDIIKYGRDSFEIHQLAECENNDLNKLEKYYIRLYDSYNQGYNMTTGGASGSFIIYDESTVMRMYRDGYSKNTIQGLTGYKWSIINHIIDTNTDEDTEIDRLNNIIKTYSNRKMPIIMIDAGFTCIQRIFESKLEALKFISKEQNKKIDKRNFYTRVTIACSTNRVCYGHTWRLGTDIDAVLDEMRNNISMNHTAIRKKYDTVRRCKNCETVINTGKYCDLCNILISIDTMNISYNTRKITRCSNCNRPITKQAITGMCNSCANVVAKGKSPKPSKEELKALLDKGLQKKQIAKLYGRTDSTVHCWINSYGLR